jgi:hypothetical protein
MLLELFVSTTVNTKLKDPHRLRPARRRSPQQSDHVQCFCCFGAGLEIFFWESSVTSARLRKPQPYSIKKAKRGWVNLFSHPPHSTLLTRGAVFYLEKQCYIGSTTQTATLLHKKAKRGWGNLFWCLKLQLHAACLPVMAVCTTSFLKMTISQVVSVALYGKS